MGRKKNYDIILKFDDGFFFKFERDEIKSTLFQEVKGCRADYFYGEFSRDAGKRCVVNQNGQEGLSLKDKLYDQKNVLTIVLLVDQEDTDAQEIQEFEVDWDEEDGKNKLQSTYIEDDVLCLEIGNDPYANY